MRALYVIENALTKGTTVARLLRVAAVDRDPEVVAQFEGSVRAFLWHPTKPETYLNTNRGVVKFDLRNRQTDLLYESNDSEGIAIDRNGEFVFVTEYNRGQLIRIELQTLKAEVVLSSLEYPCAVVIGHDPEELYVIEWVSGNNSQLVRIHPARKTKSIVAANIGQITAMTSAPREKALYLCDYSSGTLLKVWLEDGSVKRIATGLHKPSAIAFDTDGMILVLESWVAHQPFSSLSSNQHPSRQHTARIVGLVGDQQRIVATNLQNVRWFALRAE